jgi:RecJ-like exonuclease
MKCVQLAIGGIHMKYMKVEHGYCRGTGRIETNMIGGTKECSACSGQGKVEVDSNRVRCKAKDCDNGRVYENLMETVFKPCRTCQGTGWAPPLNRIK